MGGSIIVTGASRGIGLAIASYLLRANQPVVLVARSQQALEDIKQKQPVVLVARSQQALEDIKQKHPANNVTIITGDLSDFSLAQHVVDAALQQSGEIAGLVVNHGILGDVNRVADSGPEMWRETFDVNFFSVVALVCTILLGLPLWISFLTTFFKGQSRSPPTTRISRQGDLHLLRRGAERLLLVGAYGASKAALNHLAMTLKNEEPDVTVVSVRPGVVDSEMQREIREVHSARMDVEDTKKFRKAKEEGTLLRPEQPGNVIAKLALGAGKDLSGKFLSWNDPALKDFQGDD